jgi:hypothetical protein
MFEFSGCGGLDWTTAERCIEVRGTERPRMQTKEEAGSKISQNSP